MPPQSWGFDVDTASVFQGTLPNAPPWAVDAEKLLLQEDFDRALRQLEEPLDEARRSNDRLAVALGLHLMARISASRHDAVGARSAAQEAAVAFQEAESAKGSAATTLLLAKIALDVGDSAEAERLANEAFGSFGAVHCRSGEAAAQHLLARIHAREGRIEDAMEAAEKAQQHFTKVGDKEGQTAVLIVKGNMYLWNYTDALDEALKVGREAVALCGRVSRPSARHREANAAFLAASAALLLGKPSDLLKNAQDSVELLREYGGPRSQASSMRGVALGFAMSGKFQEAQHVSDDTLALLRGLPKGDEVLCAEALQVDALVSRHLVQAGASEDKTTLVHKARDAMDAFRALGDEPATALRRLELAQAMYLSGDSAAAIAEVTIALDYFKSHDLKRFLGSAFLTLAVCQLGAEDAVAALASAKEAEREVSDQATAKDVAELLRVLQPQQRSAKPKADSYDALLNPPVLVSDDSTGGVKRSTYSQLVNYRIHCGDTPEPVSFDGVGVMYMDQFLGVGMPFLPLKKPPWATAGYPQGLDLTNAPPRVVAPSAKAKAGTDGGKLVAILPRPESAAKPSEPATPSGPVVIKSAIVGTTDILGGRYRDCPEDVHDRMVTLAKAGMLQTTTLAQRQVLERKKPTLHGHAEWREAARWGYINPALPAPRGCSWQRVSVGYKLQGPSPSELLGASGQTAEPSARTLAGAPSAEVLLRSALPDRLAPQAAVAAR